MFKNDLIVPCLLVDRLWQGFLCRIMINLDEIVKNIKIMCKDSVDELAIKNVLHAKLTQLFSFKNIKFESTDNMEMPCPLSYYAFNFAPSGGNKNLSVREVDRLLPFLLDVYKEFNFRRKENLERQQVLELENNTNKQDEKEIRKRQKAEIENMKDLFRNVKDATLAQVYNYLEIIEKEQEGSLFLLNTEFLNYFEDAFSGKQANKEFLDMLFDLADGNFTGTDTVGRSRHEINGIGISLVFMSDYRLLLEQKNLTKAFKSWLARGMARRSFFYFSGKSNCYEDIKIYPYDKKQEAIEIIKNYSGQIKRLYDVTPKDMIYHFSLDANKYIDEYHAKVNKRVSAFYKNTEFLDIDTEIKKLTIEHSTWKIIKLAVLYHVLDNPTKPLVTVEDFQRAEQFFNEMLPCVDLMINKQSMSDFDKLYSYLVRNVNCWVSRVTLRKENFVQDKLFTKWLNEALVEVQNMANEHGLYLQDRISGKTNKCVEICLYDPKEYKFVVEEETDKGTKGSLVKIDNSDRFVDEI